MPYSIGTIGKAFSAERERRDLTQRALAQLAGTTQARISKIENGETDPRFSTLIEMARALDLELVLVPRRHLPAVNGIIGLQKAPSSEWPARMALDRLRNLVIQLKERLPENDDLRALDRTSRELMNLRLTEDMREPVLKVLKAIQLVSDTPALASTLDGPVRTLRRLRNDLVHRTADDVTTPRPAYRLDEDDE